MIRRVDYENEVDGRGVCESERRMGRVRDPNASDRMLMNDPLLHHLLG